MDDTPANVCEIFQNGMSGAHLPFAINILHSSYILGHPCALIPEKQCRVQFSNLDDRQRSFVADFIVNHCIS